MKTILALLAIVAATLTVTPPAAACDGVAAIGSACYAAPLVQRQVVKQYVVQPYVQQQVVEYQVVPQVQKVIQYQAAPIIQKQIVRQKVVVERQRAYPVRSSLRASASIVERIAAPRSRVIRRERVVERSVY